MGPWGGMGWDWLGWVGGWGYGANVVMVGLKYSVDFYLYLIDLETWK